MISVIEAQDLMEQFVDLREVARKTKRAEDIFKFKQHEQLCLQKFYYLVSMRTDKYRSFFNYEDLNQEGLLALTKAMRNYNPTKGLFFWWGHKYISTRISRCANTHSTIRYPLKFAKQHTPKKERALPTLIEKKFCPDKQAEENEVVAIINDAMQILNKRQRHIITLAYGFNGEKPMPVSQICQRFNIPRAKCLKIIDTALNILGSHIKF